MPRELCEFEPMTEPLDEELCTELLEKGIMPTAVASITDVTSGNMYAVHSGDKPRGLPTIDLALMTGRVTAEDIVCRRLRKRFQFELPAHILRIVPVESNISPYMRDIRNAEYPHIHYRIYYPVLGFTDVVPKSQDLRALPLAQIPDNIATGGGDDILYQMIDIHREMVKLSVDFAQAF